MNNAESVAVKLFICEDYVFTSTFTLYLNNTALQTSTVLPPQKLKWSNILQFGF
jgi:hypothetical protein